MVRRQGSHFDRMGPILAFGTLFLHILIAKRRGNLFAWFGEVPALVTYLTTLTSSHNKKGEEHNQVLGVVFDWVLQFFGLTTTQEVELGHRHHQLMEGGGMPDQAWVLLIPENAGQTSEDYYINIFLYSFFM